MTGWKNWFQKLLNDPMAKMFNSLKVPNWTNQIQTQIMIERSSPLSGATQGPCQVEEKRPVPRRSKHVTFMKKPFNMMERGNPLSAVTQITSQVTSTQCWTRWTLTSEYLDCHILLWNKLTTIVFVTWSRRSRTTLTDMLFNAIYNKTKPTTHSVKSKKMIQDVGNAEQFELFETEPKTQCTECLSYWSEGIVYCTCGHLLKENVAKRGSIEYTLDLQSIPEYVIKKGRPHGQRYGKTLDKKGSFGP